MKNARAQDIQDTRYFRKDYNQLPHLPGIYQFYNEQNLLIYIGKAKDLKKRVTSYFNKQRLHLRRTQKMVAQIHTIEFVIVNSEYEALVLESNLIKQHQPRYNVLLKDGKTYPFLCLTNPPYPRVIATRERKPSKGKYFGPFTSTKKMEQIQALIHELYPLRSCNYQLSPKNIAQKKFKICLEYHIGNCLGPCAGLQKETSYMEDVKQVAHLLKGNIKEVKKNLKEKMLNTAQERNFKEAQNYKEKLELLTNYQARSVIIQPSLGNIDVIVIQSEEKRAFVSYLYIKEGMIIFMQSIIVEKRLEEQASHLLAITLVHFRDKVKSKAKTILSNIAIEMLPTGTLSIIPKAGDKRKLVELALKNAFFFQKERLNKNIQLPQKETPIQVLQRDLQLCKPPLHIECFDISNLQGKAIVAGMVCFKKGKPAKKEFRHFHINTVKGPNDFASMSEVIKRRYSHLMKEQLPLPDLIVIDGGKGQLSAAVNTLKALEIYDKVNIISIAKKLEIIYKPNDPYPLYISKRSPSLKLLQRIRDTVHNFSLSFHKRTRLKENTSSVLTTIPTIGAKTISKLFFIYGSLENIIKAPQKKIISQIGPSKASALQKYLKKGHDKMSTTIIDKD